MSTLVTATPDDGTPDAGQTSALLEVVGLSVRFPRGGRFVSAVEGVTYSLERGRTIAIVGESGSGKTVSSRAILGLLPPNAVVRGSARFEGIELIGMPERELRRRRGPDFAMIFQDPARSLNPTMRVGDQIAEALRTHASITRKAARARALELLRLVRIPLADRRVDEYPHQLSGGMRQRVMIAIALACGPKLLVADEATTALDVTTQAQIMELLVNLQHELDMGLVMITHDMALAASFADEVVVMYAGRVVERAPSETFFVDVRMPYSRALLDAVPRLDAEPHSLLPVVPGRPPDPTRLPVGCSFAPRCPYAEDDCHAAEPPLVEHSPKHAFACFHPLRPTGIEEGLR